MSECAVAATMSCWSRELLVSFGRKLVGGGGVKSKVKHAQAFVSRLGCAIYKALNVGYDTKVRYERFRIITKKSLKLNFYFTHSEKLVQATFFAAECLSII